MWWQPPVSPWTNFKSFYTSAGNRWEGFLINFQRADIVLWFLKKVIPKIPKLTEKTKDCNSWNFYLEQTNTIFINFCNYLVIRYSNQSGQYTMHADRNSAMHLKEMLCVGIQINFSSDFGNFVCAIPQQGSVSLSAYEIPRDAT